MADEINANSKETPTAKPEVPTNEKLENLKEEVAQKGMLDEIFDTISAFIDTATSKMKEFFAGIPFLKGLFDEKAKEENPASSTHPDRSSRPEVLASGIKPITDLNKKALESLGFKDPAQLPRYASYKEIPPCTIGIINLHGFETPFYCDPNPEQKTGGANVVLVPISIVAYLVSKGYDLGSKIRMHDFMRKQLVPVNLPSTFTGNTAPIMVNPLIASHLKRAFDLMEQRGVAYHIESAGCMCWRGGRGGGFDKLASYVPYVGDHGFGSAIDFNPGSNKYAVGAGNDFPPGFVASMKEAGFQHGGDWKIPDQMHFQYPYQKALSV